jgi:hypothetical protein
MIIVEFLNGGKDIQPKWPVIAGLTRNPSWSANVDCGSSPQ